ncbi:MAG TPA: 2Fe-2S iron-sulfur cluster-binding protein [Planctomycetota bacterium]|nr:2Fe-2S iron-sulfur cluster-binding protein [Planctomycetota bacterium]
MSGTVNITVDGKQVAVPAGTNLIEAARHAGKSVPHYCYHPRLTVAGNCRICLVEIQGQGKLQIACNTKVTEGMSYFTDNERVRKAREGVMELLLINHPLDCPICDQAGECKLQEYAVEHGSGVTRFAFEKVSKPKNVSWGDRVVFDSERCILCTRCVRFLDEIAGTPEVGVDLRGEKATLIVKGDGQLTSPYQMNIIDLCPVGALTSRDFRFKSRVWFMHFTDTLCTSCARGCNTVVGSRGDRVLRMVPRTNPDVNDSWMCDFGRLHYGFANDPERLTTPRVAGKGAPYAVAISRAKAILEGARGQGILAVASPFMTNEELFALKGILDHLGVEDRYFLKPMGEGDQLLVHPEKCPNARGASLLGFLEAPAEWASKEYGVLLYVVPREGTDLPEEVLKRAKRRILFSLKDREADVCFPLTTWIEKDGTVVSAGDRLQRLTKGITFESTLVTERTVLDRLHAAFDAGSGSEGTAAQALARLAAAVPAFQGATWQRIGPMGMKLKAAGAPA